MNNLEKNTKPQIWPSKALKIEKGIKLLKMYFVSVKWLIFKYFAGKGMVKNRMSGYVYRIVNTENEKRYIGSTKRPNVRKREHFSQLRDGLHHCAQLQLAYNKYGKNKFVFEIINECETLEDARKLETEYIIKSKNDTVYNSIHNCSADRYNTRILPYPEYIGSDGEREFCMTLTGESREDINVFCDDYKYNERLHVYHIMPYNVIKNSSYFYQTNIYDLAQFFKLYSPKNKKKSKNLSFEREKIVLQHNTSLSMCERETSYLINMAQPNKILVFSNDIYWMRRIYQYGEDVNYDSKKRTVNGFIYDYQLMKIFGMKKQKPVS